MPSIVVFLCVYYSLKKYSLFIKNQFVFIKKSTTNHVHYSLLIKKLFIIICKPSGPLFFFLFWTSCFLLPMSCVEESERLTRAERKVVDSLVLKENKVLRVMNDSLCELNFEASVTEVVDSLLTKRIEEIKKILSQ